MFARAAAGAAFGAILAPALLAVSTLRHPSLVFDFDADLPRAVTAGFYPVERTPDETFAWTMPLATVTLRGIDRDVPWQCTVRLRGARPAGQPGATVALGIDGATVVTRTPAAAYEEVVVDAPARPGPATLALTISTSPAFVPGPSDTRSLGVQVDRLVCAPSGAARVAPPVAALRSSSLAGAAFGAVFGLVATGLLVSLAGSLMFAAALAAALTTGVAAYSLAYLDWITPIALWTAGPALAWAAGATLTGRRLHPAASFVLAFSSAVLCLKILVLLHPSKDVVDAVFHAHRLEWVLGGRYYFTQPMPGGVQFPYAIGLYVTAAPWAALVSDHVALLRIVVCVAEAVAAATLYVAVSRAWNDRLAGAAAVVLYHLAPLPYAVIGNANLTYAFGQSVAVVAVAAAATLTFARRPGMAAGVVFVTAALAFLSHVGVFPVLAVALCATGALYWTLGGASLRNPGIHVVLATVLAACVAIGSYYAHFPEVYRTLDRVSVPAAPADSGRETATSQPETRRASGLTDRASRAVGLGVRGLGWPLLVLAGAGAWLVLRAPRDRLTLALAGWGVSFVVFVAFRVIAPVDARYQRYADEFIDRVYYATLPATAILAARGWSWGWAGGAWWRLAAAGLGAAAAVIGVEQWIGWIR